ncbi:MAG: glutamine amidotransferase [actinobacterium acAMD-5]|jgi:glucosamine--fructose-6-phosphate aminotransferase (isomerizing)|nr:MAG: glutamine amidotransferase [actinobacterium acAMD-5]
MCGIVGYIGAKSALEVVLAGLKHMEYRGYDSAGISLVTENELFTRKKAGKLGNLQELLTEPGIPSSNLGIGHTRWATHGAPNDLNAHPHLDESGKIAIIHNGIIENFSQLRKDLTASGIKFNSETDTEVVAHLLSNSLTAGSNSLADAMREVCQKLHGAFTLVAVHADSPDVIVGARRNSPLVVGLGVGENFLASDVSAFIAHTKNALELGQDQVVELRKDSVIVTTFNGEVVQAKPFTVTWDAAAAEKGGFDLFMLKEISEQPKAVADTLRGRLNIDHILKLDELKISEQELIEIDNILIIACGTALHAGLIAKYAFEEWTRIPTSVEFASEFRYRNPVVTTRTLCIAISQSGETMDTLMAVRHAKEQGARVLSICNTQGATIPRESDAVLYTHAGPEIAVASTKAFLTQIVATYLVGLYLAQLKKTISTVKIQELLILLASLPAEVDLVLDTIEEVRGLARKFANNKSVLFLGRGVGYGVALEGALKLKELAYMHAEGFPAGELKHGPIALIEEGLLVVVVVPSPTQQPVLHEKIISNIQEVRARGALILAIAVEDDQIVDEFASHIVRVPHLNPFLQPIVSTVPLQVFACEMATARGHDVDQPRNLAKSVTVE